MHTEQKAWDQRRRALESELLRARQDVRDMQAQLEARLAEVKGAPAAPAPRKKSSAQYKQGSVLGSVNLDEGEDALSVGEQLTRALKANAGRVIDLFREWDQDGDGEITRKEFHKAMPMLGLEVPKAEIDTLFNTWDTSGEGSISYHELKKVLGGHSTSAPAAASLKKAGAAAKARSSKSSTKK